ncbi:MAG: hypothetical protein ABII01_05810 [Candidatus Woesearchaeota archaeon]
MNEKKDIMIIGIFILSILASVYFLSSSITGYVVQTMYCDEQDCDELCNTDSDCSISDEVCCDQNGFGVCKEKSSCQKRHVIKADIDVRSIFTKPVIENPKQVNKRNIPIYSMLLGLMILVFIFYIYFRYSNLKKQKNVLLKTKKKNPIRRKLVSKMHKNKKRKPRKKLKGKKKRSKKKKPKDKKSKSRNKK